MNTKILSLAVALALPFSVGAFPINQDMDHFDGHRGDKVERLAKQLELSAEQKLKLTELFTDEKAKRDALRQETHTHMQQILNPEQMAKFDEIKKNRHEKWQKHREEKRNSSNPSTQK